MGGSRRFVSMSHIDALENALTEQHSSPVMWDNPAEGWVQRYSRRQGKKKQFVLIKDEDILEAKGYYGQLADNYKDDWKDE